jgi:shikimate dehydrogenase
MTVEHDNLYAVIGNPVAHSQSPFIHAEFARQTGQVLRYERRLCPLDGLRQTLAHFAAEGGHGCNITVPFKFQAGDVACSLSQRARLAQAANVLVRVQGGWEAHNTDGLGLLNDIQVNAGVGLQGQRVLLVGAGGAGAGVLGPLIEAKPAQLAVANRTAAKVEPLLQRHADLAQACAVELLAVDIDSPGDAYDVVINATAASLQGAASPIPAAALRAGSLVVDLMYGPAAEPFLRWAARAGAVPRDGLGMLVEQAALAFELWRGVRPQTAPVLAALRARLGV